VRADKPKDQDLSQQLLRKVFSFLHERGRGKHESKQSAQMACGAARSRARNDADGNRRARQAMVMLLRTVAGVMLITIGLIGILLPFIPGLRSLPRHLGVHRLIWRK